MTMKQCIEAGLPDKASRSKAVQILKIAEGMDIYSASRLMETCRVALMGVAVSCAQELDAMIQDEQSAPD